MEKTLRQRITQIKEICRREEINAPRLADIVSENGDYVSERTIYKLLEDGSESYNFQPHTVIVVYEALINKFGDMADTQDVELLKRILTERDKQIDHILIQAERREEELESRERIYADRKKAFEHTITILKEQIEYLKSQIKIKDNEIKIKDETIQKFINLMVKE